MYTVPRAISTNAPFYKVKKRITNQKALLTRISPPGEKCGLTGLFCSGEKIIYPRENRAADECIDKPIE